MLDMATEAVFHEFAEGLPIRATTLKTVAAAIEANRKRLGKV
jgi:hypothetical protein